VEHFYHKTDAVYGTMRRLAVAQHEAANLVQVPAPAAPARAASMLRLK